MNAAAALVDVLEEMAGGSERLLAVAGHLRQQLMSGGADAILAAVAEHQRLQRELEAPEARRAQLTAALAAELGLPTSAPAAALVRQLAASGATELAARLERACQRLRANVDALTHLNAQNRALARQGLHTVAAVLEAATGEPADPAGARPAARPLRVDRRV